MPATAATSRARVRPTAWHVTARATPWRSAASSTRHNTAQPPTTVTSLRALPRAARPWMPLSSSLGWSPTFPTRDNSSSVTIAGTHRGCVACGERPTTETKKQPLVCVEPTPEELREARRRWAELVRRILEVEPLECPRCGQTMRIVGFITQPQVIDHILDHFRRTAAARCRSRAPPARARMVRAAAGSGSP